MAQPREILTIGHSTHEAERFSRLLVANRVELVGDVRRYPASRRNPQFNATALGPALTSAGIRYEPLGEALGGRRRSRRDPGNSGWKIAGFRAYADHMQTEEFSEAIVRLEALAMDRRTAIMCAEGDWRRCHRRLIADALAARGWRVVHIGPDGSTEEHALPDFSVVAGGRVEYRAQRSLEV